LESIKAEHSKVAASDPLASVIGMIETRPDEWKKEFLKYMREKSFIIVVKSRARWNEYKGGGIEL